ncbi:MAG TPA: threonine ammonia-lyase [Myxococcaceae bacterium]|nr:threonine ammonia-lyase [Myxococcaceae bacterium]
MVTLDDIREAQRRISGRVYLTPCPSTDHFVDEVGCRMLYMKLENLQRTGSFKERGALNKMLTLTEAERRRGVIAASAGNHAQGVAFHAGRLGIDAVIVMPERTPLIKVSATRGYGAEVVLHGNSFDDAYGEATRLQAEQDRVFIHPFDDPHVIAGQGTIGLELFEQVPDMEMVIVSIGGGGLIAGVGCALKTLNPKIQVIGVQTEKLPSMQASVAAGQVVQLPGATTLAEGVAVKRPGDQTFAMVQKYVDAIVTVDEEEIANAILRLLEQDKTVVEGAGALPLAALLNGKVPAARGKNVAAILCGGNIDVNLVSRIIDRGLVKDGRLMRLTVMMSDRPGALAAFVGAIAEQGANVVEIHHNRAFLKGPLAEAQVKVTLETRGRAHITELLDALSARGWAVSQDV